jgi:hypothetical protein
MYFEIRYIYKRAWATAAASARRGAGFPWGGARGSPTAHSPMQSATLPSQHDHYLRWSNLHVCRSVMFYNMILWLYRLFPCICDWTVAVTQCSKSVC